MDRLHRVIGPLATNVHVLADERSREAIAIDTAMPCLSWIAHELAARDWTLKLIVSTHGHWDHIGDNASVAEHTGADIAVHPLDRDRLIHPQPVYARSRSRPRCRRSISPEADEVRFGEIRLHVLHTRAIPRGPYASSSATRDCSSVATPCSRPAGVASTCPVATPTRWRRH